MSREDQAFMKERAEALAVVALTRREDIQLQRGPKWSGYDISAVVMADGKPTSCSFAVQVVPTEAELTDAQVKKLVRKTEANPKDQDRLEIPRLLLLADVIRDDVQYLWRINPKSLTDDKSAGNTTGPRKLDSKGLDEVVASVQEWYSNRSSRRAA